MWLRRKPDNKRLTGRDWEELRDYLRRFRMIMGGRGVLVKNLPPGITISVNPAEVQTKEAGGTQTELARIWTYGPNESPSGMTAPSRPAGKEYWVREIQVNTMAVKEGGFWEAAYNLAEKGIPGGGVPGLSEAPSLFHPIMNYEEEEPEEYKYNIASASIESQNWDTPIVPTWKIATSNPEVPYKRVFFLWPFEIWQEVLMQYGSGYDEFESYKTRLTHCLDIGITGQKFLTPTIPPNGSWFSETPSGTVNGTNDTFTLTYTPDTNMILLFKKMYMVKDSDYTLSAKTITYAAGQIPQVGIGHHVHYIKAGA